MKKLILSAAALAIVVSCSKNEVVEVVSSDASVEKTIGFSTLNDRVTKAANDSSSDYSVFAKKASDNTNWYINEGLSTATYYWPTGGSAEALDFYAFAPATSAKVAVTDEKNQSVISVVATNGEAETIDITYTVNDEASEDFTVATPIRNNFYAIDADESTYASGSFYTGSTPAVYTGTAGNVDFKFSHMLSKATINVTLSQDLIDAQYYIGLTSATFNVVSNQVVVNLTNETATPGITTASTTVNSTNSVAYPYTLAASGGTVTSVEGTQALMFAPQDAYDEDKSESLCSIDLTGLAIVTAGASSSLLPAANVTYEFASGAVVFESGKSYAITITVDATDTELGTSITANKITFTADIAENTWNTDDSSVALATTGE